MLGNLDLRHSMGRTGICYYNAMAGSFLAALKNGLVNRIAHPIRAAAIEDNARYIEARCNRRRLHSSIGYRPPNEAHDAYRSERQPRDNDRSTVQKMQGGSDRSTVRTGNAPRVMATLRPTAISLLRLTGINGIAKATRHHARDATGPAKLMTC